MESCKGGIIPAFAGSTHKLPRGNGTRWDHPRVRGEHNMGDLVNTLLTGSSPRSQGALVDDPLGREAGGIIPAFAGSTPSALTSQGRNRDHPRVRGEHSISPQAPRWTVGSSPRSRGAHTDSDDGDDVDGIIPAFAGSTVSPASSCQMCRDHPRVRGEHRVLMMRDDGIQGSSPRSRGARVQLGAFLPAVGIIPAFAGSTASLITGRSSMRDHPRVRGEHSCNS